jgi:hypothetical protein
MLALPPSGRRVPLPPRTLLLVHRSYRLMRQSRMALLYFGFWPRSWSLRRLLPAPAATGILPTLSLRILPQMPERMPRRFAECVCLLLAPPVGADQVFTQPMGTFISGLPTVWLPSPPPDITTTVTGQVLLAGLSPARTPTSIAAIPHPDFWPGISSGEPVIRPEFHANPAQSPHVHK